MGQDPDTASIILENIQINQMNEAQLAEYNLLCTQLNERIKISPIRLISKSVRQFHTLTNTAMNFRNQRLIFIWHA